MTYATMLRVLLAFQWAIDVRDLAGFKFLLPAGWKRRYPPMDAVTRCTLEVISRSMDMPSPLAHIFIESTAGGITYDGGTCIQESLIYG